MANNSKNKKQNYIKVEKFLQDIGIYYLDEETTRIYGELKAEIFAHFAPQEYAKRRNMTIGKLGFSDNDLWIAAHAVRNDISIISEDSDYKRMCEAPAINFSYECWK